MAWIAAGMAAAQMLGGMAAGQASKEAAERASEIQQRSMDDIRERLEAIGIPSEEAMRIALEKPEVGRQLILERLGPTALEGIAEDPRLKLAKRDVLSKLEQAAMSEEVSPEEALRYNRLRDQIAGQAEAQKQSTLRSMAERGTMDSGSHLAAQLASQQASTQRLSQEGMQMAADRSRGKMDALSRYGGMASQMSAEQMAQLNRIASAKDAISQANLGQSTQERMSNLAREQQVMDQQVAIANQQEMYNKQIAQQRYNMQTQQAGLMNQAQMQGAGMQSQAEMMKGQGQAQMFSGMGSAVSSGLGAYGSYQAGQQANAASQAEGMKTRNLTRDIYGVGGHEKLPGQN